MNKKKNDSWQLAQRLRARAEAKLARIKLPNGEHPPQQHADELLHELRVHQIELEMQNEELRRVQLSLEKARDRYVDLYEFAPIGYLTLSATGMIAEINLTGATLLGAERVKLINRRFSQYIAPEDRERWQRHFLYTKQQESKQAIELTFCRADGTRFHAYLDCLTIKADDVPPELRITLTDITQTKLAEQQLRIAAIIFEAQEGMMVTDAEGVILQVNHAFTQITGYSCEEVIGKKPRLLQSGRHDDDFYRTMWDSIQRTGAWKGEIWNRHKNGEVYPARFIITAVPDQHGSVSHYVATFEDITLRKLATDEIERLAFYDPLTDLPNRRQLLTRLHQALASSTRHNEIGAILFIDLDNFKILNDTYGHCQGDLLLQQIAQRLVACVREDDTVARLGGDEFVVMLENLSTDSEEAVAEARVVGTKILATLNQPYQLNDCEHCSSSSIGITLFHGRQNSVEELLKQADIAMYQAKSSGRNTLRFFDPEMQSAVTARAMLETELHKALSEKQFKFYFQIQMNHLSNIIGAEMLIRWQRMQRDLIASLDFIPMAEKMGLILPIGYLVLETAGIQLKKWQDQPTSRNLQLAININTHQFHHPDFVEQVSGMIKKIAIDPRKLELELAESVVLSDINDTILKMTALKEVGVCFCMDDFGTGYSSLSYLSRLPFDQIKIDRSFVRNIGVKTTDTAIIQTIIGICNNLGIEVIAEGVETEVQRVFLEQHGCFLYQGYLFGQPVSLQVLEKLLHQSTLI